MKSISIIREKADGEKRVIATPRQVLEFKKAGFEVYVEEGAGLGVGFLDHDYELSGARVVDTKKAWQASNVILKYKPPVDSEFKYINEEKHVGAVFHAEGVPELTKRLLESNCTAYSYEFFKTPSGIFPLSVASSEIAGKVAVIYGAYHLQTHLGGSGVLLAPVLNTRPAKVVVIGYGNSGGAAARLAASMGGDVVVFGTNPEKLRAFAESTPQNVKCIINTSEVLAQEVKDADLIIGAILISTYDTPEMLTEEMVKTMKKGAVIVDVTCGYGTGYMPTFDKHTNFKTPIYEKHGVLHCKIDILPAGYVSTTVQAMSAHLCPYLINFANSVLSNVSDPTSKAGMIVQHGKIIHHEVERHMSDLWSS